MPKRLVIHPNGVREIIKENVTPEEEYEWFKKFGGPPKRAPSANQLSRQARSSRAQGPQEPPQEE